MKPSDEWSDILIQLQARQERLSRQITELRAALSAQEHVLQAVKGNACWKLGDLYGRLKYALFPSGTRRRRLYNSVMARLGSRAEPRGQNPEASPPAETSPKESGFWPEFDAPSLSFAPSGRVAVSVVIPVHGQHEHTFACLKSLREHVPHQDYEVIVVDDGSRDLTPRMLSRIKGIRVIRNDANLGFVHSCNRGAAQAQGEYLLFLNNDTLFKPPPRDGMSFLDELLDTFQLRSDAGLVGAKLLYPDGKLQEAGGIVWRDASGRNYGRGGDPDLPQYNYLREVDYCSGACIMIPRRLFLDLGGFDARYAPAYYEDTDLAFRVREVGRSVLYQPLAQVVHHEGVTSGTDTASGAKRSQVLNQAKFQERWAAVLSGHGAAGDDEEGEKERRVVGRILVVDAHVPMPDQDSGSLDVFNYIKIFMSLGYKVTFVPDDLLQMEWYTKALQRRGAECLHWPHISSVESHLKRFGERYDAVFMSRAGIARGHIDAVRKFCPKARVIYNTIDLQWLRVQRQALVEDRPDLLKRAAKDKALDLGLAAEADCTLVVSPVEKELLLRENPRLDVTVVPPPREVHGTGPDFSQRQGIMFLGNFLHEPNVDAVLYFVESILPLVRATLGEIDFLVAGSRPPPELMRLAGDHVVVTGYAQDLTKYCGMVRMSVAPLRYGAGVKGKILTSLCHGLPVVGTPLALEGMSLRAGQEVLVAESPEDFAKAVAALHCDPELWSRLSRQGLEAVGRMYSLDSARGALREALGLGARPGPSAEAFAGGKAAR